MIKYTPGPWTVVDGFSNVEWKNFCIRPVIAGRTVPFSIAKVPKGQVAIGDALLISAAPDLLKVAEMLIWYIDEVSGKKEKDVQHALSILVSNTRLILDYLNQIKK